MPPLSPEQALEFLATGTHTAKLATASASGAPHVTPVWFLVDGGDLVFVTGRDSVKGRHLRANPRAAIAVDDEQFPYAFAAVRGPVELQQEAPDLLAWNIRIAERYVPFGEAEAYGKRNTGPAELLCRLHAERITGATAIAL